MCHGGNLECKTKFTHCSVLNIGGQVVLHLAGEKPDDKENVNLAFPKFQHKNHLDSDGSESKKFEGCDRRLASASARGLASAPWGDRASRRREEKKGVEGRRR